MTSSVVVTIAVAALFGAWLAYRVPANLRLVRPPLLDEHGQPYPTSEVMLPGGKSVGLIDVGAGEPVFLLPGADGMKETWRYQVPELARWHRVIAADLRTEIPPGADLDLLCDDAVAVMASRGIESAIVVGQSLGGAIAMRLAHIHPDRVRGLVIVNSLARVSYEHVGLNRTLLVPVAMGATRYLPTFAARWAAALWSSLDVWVFDSSAGRNRVIDYVLWTGPRTVSPNVSGARVDLLKGTDLRPDLRSIDVPTLVMKGAHDTYVPVAWSREIADLVPGARYEEVPEAGHCAHISTPDHFNRILLDWLNGLGEPPRSKEAEA